MVTAERELSDTKTLTEQRLTADPGLETSDVEVNVTGGIVVLTGASPTFAQRCAAEDAVKEIPGVSALINRIEVKPAPDGSQTDEQLASLVVEQLRWDARVPRGHVTATVDAGRVTLEGTVDWAFQAKAALDAVAQVQGIVSLTSLIAVRPRLNAEQIAGRIEEALKRRAALDAQTVDVDVVGTRVILRGHVRSWWDREAAEDAAARTMGVTGVDNHIRIANW
ncbi:MAG TPA: BON domain-containing protein [Dehalococcoidia bacterium]|nr:BON domain-containing protein [Dehalococcoidia bacterium]